MRTKQQKTRNMIKWEASRRSEEARKMHREVRIPILGIEIGQPCLEAWIDVFTVPYMRLSSRKIFLLPLFHPVLHLNKNVGRREMPSGIKLHWPSRSNKSSMSAEPNAVQAVRDYAGANNEIIKMKEIVLSIVEATKVYGYCWSTSHVQWEWGCTRDPHRWSSPYSSPFAAFKHLGSLMDMLP